MTPLSCCARPQTLAAFAAAFALLATAAPARALLVVFQDGRSLHVRTYEVEGEEAVVHLPSGGSMRFSKEVVARVAEDEDIPTPGVRIIRAPAPPPPPPAPRFVAPPQSPPGSIDPYAVASDATTSSYETVPQSDSNLYEGSGYTPEVPLGQ